MSNILHIFVDQMRADAVAALGNPIIRTPHLDRLCAEGTAFTRAYSPSPVCVAARCSMIFGQYPHHTGCYNNGTMPTDGRETFMAALGRAGYRTHGIGKCHFTPERRDLRGFGSREVQEEGAGLDDYQQYLQDNGLSWFLEPHGVRGEMYYVPQPSQLPAEHHGTQWVGDRAVAFLNEAAGGSGSGSRSRTSGAPWYLYASFIHPHPPFAPPSPWHKLYRAAQMPLPNMPPDTPTMHTYINRIQNRYKYRDQGLDANLLRCMKAYYYGCISFIDYQVGRMLAALDAAGTLDDTLVLFTSDHGEYLGDYGCFGKRGMHDAAARVPLIARQPGVFAAGTQTSTPASLVDLAPTFLAAAGAAIDSHPLDGQPLQQVANGTERRHVIAQHMPTTGNLERFAGPQYVAGFGDDGAALRAATSSYLIAGERWKYAYSSPDRLELLFDAVEDPLETRNRAGLTATDSTVAHLRKQLMGVLRDGGEEAALDGMRWRHYRQPSFPVSPDVGLLVQDMYVPWGEPHLAGYSPSGPASAQDQTKTSGSSSE